MKYLKVLVVALFCLFILKASNLWAFSFLSYPPMQEALTALESDYLVDVERTPAPMIWNLWNMFEEYYTFKPADGNYVKGFVFYPGGLVDYRSYAPLAREIAAAGYLAVIVKMPFDIGFLGFNRAACIYDEHPEVEKWAIGGHSLGGVASCNFIRQYPELMNGLVLWASYPSESFRLDEFDLPVISIYGSKDGLSTIEKIENSKQHLPVGTGFVEIIGGNHTQFGWYDTGDTPQRGDNEADITRQQQQDEIIEATTGFIDGL